MTAKEKEIANYMKKLGLTKEEAEELWLADNGLEENEEQNALDKKAKAVKVDAGVEKEKKPRKPREVKVSNAKKELFAIIRNAFDLNDLVDYEIITENKLFRITFEGKIFDLNLIEKRPPKK